MNRSTLLNTALTAVTQDRAATHGNPENNFELIASLWGAYLGIPISATDVAAMMILLKIARTASNPRHEDHWVDIAGYAACGGEIATLTDMDRIKNVAAGL